MNQKSKQPNPKHIMHWSARFSIKFGTIIALCILLLGFLFPKASFYAIMLCKCSVSSFSVSVIGGLMLDVVAIRKGMSDDF